MELNTVTIAFGHGLSVAPLQAMMAIGALVNGGTLIPPTFLKRSEAEAAKLAQQVIKPETSERMRYLMRLNAEKGTATRADVKGYYVGGKTGTSEKSGRRPLFKTKLLTTFTAAAGRPAALSLFCVICSTKAAASPPKSRAMRRRDGTRRRRSGAPRCRTDRATRLLGVDPSICAVRARTRTILQATTAALRAAFLLRRDAANGLAGHEQQRPMPSLPNCLPGSATTRRHARWSTGVPTAGDSRAELPNLHGAMCLSGQRLQPRETRPRRRGFVASRRRTA
jgi:hypothetical protein